MRLPVSFACNGTARRRGINAEVGSSAASRDIKPVQAVAFASII
jgi:hypothetical protein